MIQRQHLSFIFWSLAAVTAFATTGCGKNSGGGLVSGAQFSTIEENGELYGDLKVNLSTGNVLLPSFDLPILNPKNPGAVYGVVSMRDALSAGTQLEVKVDLNQIAGLEGADGSLLPNGRAIPVALGQGVHPIAVSVKGNSRVYLAFAENTAMVGTAIVIPEFDKIGSSVGPIDVFFPFQADNGVKGAAGLFSSTQSGQSGVAVFVDVSSVMQSMSQKNMSKALAVSAKSSRAGASAASSVSGIVGFRTQQSISNMQAYRLSQFMKKLGDRGQRLRIQ